MGVADRFWWGVWWPWMTLWIVTFTGLAAVILLALIARRRAKAVSKNEEHRVVGVCVYLHARSIMDIYQSSDIAQPLQQEVQKIKAKSHRFTLAARLFGLDNSSERSISAEDMRSYLIDDEPITVINRIMDNLEKTSRIVYVDLRKGRISRNRAALKSLSTGREQEPASEVLLSEIEYFIWIKGRFQTVQQTKTGTKEAEENQDNSIVYLAPYENLTPPASPQAYVQIICSKKEFRSEGIFHGPFQARCLGKISHWDPRTGRLNVDPIAIFR